ncbi:recombinase family protein [Bacillus cereus]|uniref:recombinase family protein n=1 Tax=Bacillus cereus TaxID=1396 RepID=UPI0024BE2C49|nr:recombinase family protein [Bacillus cereus]
MRKTVTYYRSSTDFQENSIDMQQVKAFEYGIKNKLPIDEEYIDQDVSARKKTLMQRPEMYRLINDIEAGIVGKIIVYKRDRLARKLQEHMKLYQLFQKHSIEVHFSSDSEVDMYYSAIGEYVEAILGSICENEGSLIAQRIQETKIAQFLSGKYAGNLPYGYKYDKPDSDGKVTIVPISHEMDMVKAMFYKLANKKYENMKEFCNDMNQIREGKRQQSKEQQEQNQEPENQKVKKQDNKPWDQSRVVKIITNPLYYGLRVMKFGDKAYKKTYKDTKVIEKEEWDIANEKLNQIMVKREYTKEKVRFLLANLLYCYQCQKQLITKTRMKSYEHYHVYECEEHDVCVEMRYVEEEILKHAKQFFNRLLDTNFDKLYERSRYQNIQRIQKLIRNQERTVETHEKKVGKFVDAWLSCKRKIREYEEIECEKCKTNQHEKEIKEANEQLKKEKNKLKHLKLRLHEIRNFREKAKEWLSHLECPADLLLLKKEHRIQFYREMIHCIHVDTWEYHIVFKHPFMLIQEVHQESE